MACLPDVVGNDETLGRAVFDSQKARRAARDGAIHPKIFREKDGIRELSVDRLSFGNHLQIANSHDEQRQQKCLGWATVSAHIATRSGRSVFSDPIKPANPHHAVILLPDLGEDPRDVQQEHAVELATAAQWIERPSAS
jgi:hypothetical protein